MWKLYTGFTQIHKSFHKRPSNWNHCFHFNMLDLLSNRILVTPWASWVWGEKQCLLEKNRLCFLHDFSAVLLKLLRNSSDHSNSGISVSPSFGVCLPLYFLSLEWIHTRVAHCLCCGLRLGESTLKHQLRRAKFFQRPQATLSVQSCFQACVIISSTKDTQWRGCCRSGCALLK